MLSWENGTKAEAILEYNYPSLSVFADTPFPLPSGLNVDQMNDVYNIAQTTLQQRPASASNGSSSLLEDGSSGDPASLGIAVLLANASTNNAEVKSVGYGTAAEEELNYLLYSVPRVSVMP